MIVFVDGHNALHVLGVDEGGHEADRGALIADVRKRARKMTPGTTVFFDGHPPPGEFADSGGRGVRVVFSLSREADESIVDAVREHEQTGRVLVVTDDLELARRVEQLGARTSRVRAFFAKSAPAASAEEKPTGAGGFTAADFGLPDAIELDDPSSRKPLPKRLRRRPR